MSDITTEEIIGAVARKYGVDVRAITGKRSDAAIVKPRHVAMNICLGFGFSVAETARAFGKERTAVSYAVKKIARMMLEDVTLMLDIAELEHSIERRPDVRLAKELPDAARAGVMALIDEATQVGRDAMCAHLAANLPSILAGQSQKQPETVT